MLTVVSMRASRTFAAGQSSEIGRYEVPREESFPGLRIWMTIDDFQIAGIRQDVTESLKSVVRYSIALGPGSFRWFLLVFHKHMWCFLCRISTSFFVCLAVKVPRAQTVEAFPRGPWTV